MNTETHFNGAGALIALPLIAIVLAIMVCQFSSPATLTTYEAPPQAAPSQAQARDWSKSAERIGAALEEVAGFRPNLKAEADITSFEGELSPTLPRNDSPHTSKHPDYVVVKDAIAAWLATKEACGMGVTVHLRANEDYTPPALEIMTICWHIGNAYRYSGFVLVDMETKMGITGFIAPTQQLCRWLVRDGYSPSTAPACASH